MINCEHKVIKIHFDKITNAVRKTSQNIAQHIKQLLSVPEHFIKSRLGKDYIFAAIF